eukprot:449985_1
MADEQKEMSVQERLQALTILGPVQGSLKDAFNQTSTSSSTVRNGTFDEIAQMSGFSHPNDIAWLWMQIKYLPDARQSHQDALGSRESPQDARGNASNQTQSYQCTTDTKSIIFVYCKT